MRNTFKILFYIKRKSLLRNGKAPIMARITVNGQRAQFATQLCVAAADWDVAAGQVSGNHAEAVRINDRLSRIRYRIECHYDSLLREGETVTAVNIRELYFGIDTRKATLLAFFRQHNDDFARQVGVSRSRSSLYKYRCVCDHLERFIRSELQRDDLPFRELNRAFITQFHAYLAQKPTRRKNTVWVYMIAFKHILMLARSKGHLALDLFAGYKLRGEFVTRNFLTISEINAIIRYNPGGILQLVRDAFLFSCFTGLAYVDICNLTLRNIQQEDNHLWLNTTRHKTGTDVHVRLFAIPHSILLKYMPLSPDVSIFDLPTNSWCNRCLGQISARIGLAKHITFHAARHTFATTITLSQGVAIETICKLLGHRDIHTTQIYAAVTHSHLGGEMNNLARRLDTLCCRLPGL